MAAPDYSTRSFDLAIARDRTTILDVGVELNGVTVQQVPGGTTVALHFGGNKDAVPILSGDSWDVEADEGGCPVPANEGLFMTNPVGAGLVVLVLSFGPIYTGARKR